MAEKEIIPRYYELEQFRRSINRRLWFACGGLLLWSFACLALALAVILKPTPVIAFDGQGRAMVFEDTITPRLRLEEVRVRYFARQFIERCIAIDSANLDRDLAECLNMMMPAQREIAMSDSEALERRARYIDANVRTRLGELDLKIAPYDPETSEKVHLVVWGKLLYEPREGELPQGEEAPQQWFFTKMALRRVPIGKMSIFGMLVSYAQTRLFTSEDEMRIERLKRRP